MYDGAPYVDLAEMGSRLSEGKQSRVSSAVSDAARDLVSAGVPEVAARPLAKAGVRAGRLVREQAQLAFDQLAVDRVELSPLEQMALASVFSTAKGAAVDRAIGVAHAIKETHRFHSRWRYSASSP